MSWEDVFKVLAAAIISAGGAGGLILLISKFLSKAMFEKYMEKIKHEYDKDLEATKHKYDKDLEVLKHKYDENLTKTKAKFDNMTFLSNLQYEKEFQIYLEITEQLHKCITSFEILNDDLYCMDNIEMVHIKSTEKEIVKFNEIFGRYQAFMDGIVYLDLLKITKSFYRLLSKSTEIIDKKIDSNRFSEIFDEEDIRDQQFSINLEIKEYLQNFKIR